MNVTKFDIQGPMLIELKMFGDARGFFTERFRKDKFAELELPEYIQENFSRSAPGILRGLHYQFDLPQGKLVTCLSGRIFDVAVDVRRSSPTLGKHVSVEIDGDKPAWFWVPAGFAHGFCVMGDKPADVMYKVDNYYNPKGEQGIAWNDPDFAIKWPLSKPILSAKDEVAMRFEQYKLAPKF